MRSLYHFLRAQLCWLCDQRCFRYVLRTGWLYVGVYNCFAEFARATIRSQNDQPVNPYDQLFYLIAGFGFGFAAAQLEEWTEESYQRNLQQISPREAG